MINNKIIRIKCPNCQERYMISKNANGYRKVNEENEWYCLSCPIWVWTEEWFNKFKQFEHLVTRSGMNSGK